MRAADSFIDLFSSPIGDLYLVFSGRRLTAIEFQRPRTAASTGTSRQATLFKKELDAYFRGRLREFRQEVEFLTGTDFEKQVWLCLRKIPYGETRTYKWIAERVGRPRAVRAAGQALAKNPVPIVIPCHRVIQSDGSLGGYSGGIDIKRRLLDLEHYSRPQVNEAR